MGLLGFLLVYRVLADRERDWSAVDFLAEVFCKLLLERFAAPAAVMELLRRAVLEFVFFNAELRSPLAVVLAPAVVAPAATAPAPDRLLPLVMLALLDFEGSMLLAPYFE
jgi:hypothetical protein